MGSPTLRAYLYPRIEDDDAAVRHACARRRVPLTYLYSGAVPGLVLKSDNLSFMAPPVSLPGRNDGRDNLSFMAPAVSRCHRAET